MPKMIKVTEFRTKDNWEGSTNTVADETAEIYVSVDRIITMKVGQYYRGADAGGGPEHIDKTLIAFGGEDYIFVNETIDEVLQAIQFGMYY